MTVKLAERPKTVGSAMIVGASIVAGAILWWWGKDVYGWIKSKVTSK